jgi:hypothetical protein
MKLVVPRTGIKNGSEPGLRYQKIDRDLGFRDPGITIYTQNSNKHRKNMENFQNWNYVGHNYLPNKVWLNNEKEMYNITILVFISPSMRIWPVGHSMSTWQIDVTLSHTTFFSKTSPFCSRPFWTLRLFFGQKRVKFTKWPPKMSRHEIMYSKETLFYVKFSKFSIF